MSNDNVVDITKREFVADPLTDILRQGARKLLAAALAAEIDSFLSEYESLKDKEGKKRLIRNGYMPQRSSDGVNCKCCV